MEEPVVKDKRIFTPFNVITGIILLVGFVLAIIRFTQGLASTTNTTDTYPWGLFIGFNVMAGVALSAGGFVIGTFVYLFGMKKFHLVLRPAILTGFLGYFFVVVALSFDLGRPWRLPYPMFVSFGVTSVLFLVAWHVALYLSCQFVEISPAIFEWLGWKNWRKVAVSITIGVTVFGVILSTLHQSALGALFLLAPSKLHPLWYSSSIPIFFFVSAIAAGISVVIFVELLTRKYFKHQIRQEDEAELDDAVIGLAQAGSVVLFTYFAVKVVGIASGNHWSLLNTPYGNWFLFELLGFALLPSVLFGVGYRNRNVRLIRFTALLAILGIVLNRLNVSIIAFQWYLPPDERYVPSWMELAVSIAIITFGIWTFRWIVNRMPILREHPEYKNAH